MSGYSYALLGVYGEIRKQLWAESEGPNIDSTSLRINYKVTVSILLFSCVIVTFHNWFGLGKLPIECYVGGDSEIKFLDDYCWLHPKNISVENDAWTKAKFDKFNEGFPVDPQSRKHSVHYYQWTAFFLLFQALCFYVPRFMWARWENGTMANFKSSLDIKEWDDEKKSEVAANLLLDRSRQGYNKMYALGYCVSEVVAVLNITLQWGLTSRFLGTVETDWFGSVNFYNLGWKVMLGGDDGTRYYLPLFLMFPRQIHCLFTTYGTGAAAVTKGARCILPLNIINDKVYITIWFWFVFVTVITSCNLIYRIFVYINKPLRRMKLDWEVLERKKDENKDYILDVVCKRHSDFLIFENFRENFSKIVVRKTLIKMYQKEAEDKIEIEKRRMDELKRE